jgi:hypothetical protein
MAEACGDTPDRKLDLSRRRELSPGDWKRMRDECVTLWKNLKGPGGSEPISFRSFALMCLYHFRCGIKVSVSPQKRLALLSTFSPLEFLLPHIRDLGAFGFPLEKMAEAHGVFLDMCRKLASEHGVLLTGKATQQKKN